MTCNVPPTHTLHKVVPDGSCLFRALIRARADIKNTPLSAEQERAQAASLRRGIVQYIKDNEDDYNEKWKMTGYDIPHSAKRAYLVPKSHRNYRNENNETLRHHAYVRMMSKPTTYGTQLELQIAAKLLQRRICVHNIDGSSHIVDPIDDTPVDQRQAVIHVFLNDLHYDVFLKRTRPNRPPRASNVSNKTTVHPSRPTARVKRHTNVNRMSREDMINELVNIWSRDPERVNRLLKQTEPQRQKPTRPTK